MVRRRNRGTSSAHMDYKVEETSTAASSTKVEETAAASTVTATATAPNQNQEIDVSKTQQLLGNVVTLMEKLSMQLEQQRVELEKDRSLKQIRDFISLNSPTFDGKYDPIMADKWLRETKKTLNILSITGARSVELATFQLKGQANYWWDSIKEDYENISTWEKFEELFLEKYFPEAAKDRLMAEFHNPAQRNMTVAEFAARIDDLSQFIPYTVLDYDKMEKFHAGLNMSIKMRFGRFEVTTFCELVNRAMVVEQELSGSKQILR